MKPTPSDFCLEPPEHRACWRSLGHTPACRTHRRRSVLFVFVTGEEMGLLGSDYFAYFPTVPRRSIVANVNIDGAPGLYYAMKEIVPLGAEHASIGNDVELAARQTGYEISPDPMPEEMQFIRSDQYSFVLQGIPAVNIIDGVNASDPKVDGLAVIKKRLTTRYHTPLDNMDQPLDYDSAARASGLNFLVGYQLAQQDQPPAWNKGDFFWHDVWSEAQRVWASRKVAAVHERVTEEQSFGGVSGVCHQYL